VTTPHSLPRKVECGDILSEVRALEGGADIGGECRQPAWIPSLGGMCGTSSRRPRRGGR
jgi:hypothetical protein